MRHARRNTVVAVAAVLVVLAITYARGQNPSARLQALRADPMAAYVPPGGRLVDVDEQNEGTALGKPVFARYARLFAVPPGTGEAVLRRARAAAEAAGWTQVGRDDPRVFVADRRLPSGRAELGLTLLDARLIPKGVEPPVLLVSLRHLGP